MIEVIRYSNGRQQQFTELLIGSLTRVFGCKVDELPENYNKECPWGLLRLLDTKQVADYYLILVDGQVWAGVGGMIRQFEGQQIYQAAFRGFSCARYINTGLGMKSLVHKYVTGTQIDQARSMGCESLIISFNEHNKRLFEITHKYIMPRALPQIEWAISDSSVIFNGVPQWLMAHKLQS